MRKRSIVKVFLLAALICLMASGCTGRNEAEKQEAVRTTEAQPEGSGIGKDWKVQYREIEVCKGETLLNIVGTENLFFTVKSISDAAGSRQSLVCLEAEALLQTTQKQVFSEADVVLPLNCGINLLFSNGEEQLCLLGTSYTESDTSHFLISINEAAQTVKQTDITAAWRELWGEEVPSIHAAADGNGTIYLGDFWNTHKILVIKEDGNKIAEINLQDMEIYDMTCADGKIYCAGTVQGTDTLFQIDSEKWIMEALDTLPQSKGTMLLQPGGEDTLLYGCQDTLYRYDVKTGEGENIFAWSNAGIEGRHISNLVTDEKGNIYVFSKGLNAGENMMLVLLEAPSEEKELAEREEEINKETIKICGSKAQDTELAKAVARFNVTNEHYQVEIVEYDYDRLLAEIVSGKGPDLIPLTDLGVTECVRKGIIEDLTPYLEKSSKLSKDMLNEKIINLYTIDGILTCIPPSFYVSSLYGKESELGREAGWTLEEFMDYVDSHRGLTVMEGSMKDDSRMVIMLMMWRARQQEWIDWEQGKASFQQGEFEKLLRFAASYESKYDRETGSTEERWQEGKILLYSRPVTSMERYLWFREILEGDMVAVGYPTQDGTPCNQIGIYGEYGINVKSEHKDGAWAFIEYLVSCQTGEESYQNGIPTLNSAMEAMLQESMEEKKRNIGGFDIPKATEEDTQAFLKLIENAAVYDEGNSVIEGILNEELSSCFYNERSVEDTIQIIQNRVQLYLEE